MELTRHAVTVNGFADPPGRGALTVVSWSRGERWRRAWAGLGTCWGIAVGTIFIPVAHFLLVPGFGVAGPIVFVRRLGRTAAIRDAHGTCPDCQAAQDFAVRGPPADRIDTRCQACGRGLTLRRTAPGP